MSATLAPFRHLIKSVEFTDNAIFIKLNEGLASMGAPLICVRSHEEAVKRLELVRPTE